MWPFQSAPKPPDQLPDSPRRRHVIAQLEGIENLAVWYFVFLVMVILLYAFAAVPENTASQYAHVVGILVALLIAAAVIGAFLGFLFGIPRLLQQSAKPQLAPAGESDSAETKHDIVAGDPRQLMRTNSNLEEISDWVTKIIVGLGLVQAGKIYDAATSAAEQFQLSALPDATGSNVIFLLLLTAGAIGGFIYFYMETRTRIALLLDDIETTYGRPVISKEAIAESKERSIIVPVEQNVSSNPTVAANPTAADEAIMKVPFESLRTADQLAAWGAAQARAGNLEAALRALRDAVQKKPGDPDLLKLLSQTQMRRENWEDAFDSLSEAADKSEKPELVKQRLLAALYLPSPESFEKAIPIAQGLARNPETERDPFVQLWSAAAYGQKYSWAKTQGRPAEELKALREQARKAVKRVIDLTGVDSPARRLLRQTFDPSRENSSSRENDLEVFKGDEEFQKLIYGQG